MRDEVADWVGRRTFRSAELPPASELKARKGDRTVALVVPALDEAQTIGGVLDAVAADSDVRSLLDDIVVIDGGSTDGTARIASLAGARVVRAQDVAAGHVGGGKGGSVWRAVQETTADLLVVVDADLDPFRAGWVSALLAPLLLVPEIALVKAAADRPLKVDGILHPRSGGRVTELMARPLLNAMWPELAGVAQPLAGEIAARRDLLERLSFVTGYGLEIGMLIDTYRMLGLDAIAQVDIGERHHRHQSDLALGRMASAVLRTALSRAGVADLPDDLVQFTRDDDGHLVLSSATVLVNELPAIRTLPGRLGGDAHHG